VDPELSKGGLIQQVADSLLPALLPLDSPAAHSLPALLHHQSQVLSALFRSIRNLARRLLQAKPAGSPRRLMFEKTYACSIDRFVLFRQSDVHSQ
jgi:hypothetical protein